MKPVDRSEILDLTAYEHAREAMRRRVIEQKRVRRVALGSNITVLFENHDTVLFHVQEMLRTERIVKEEAVLHELETYNELIPATDELSATIFIEYPDAAERERMLAALAGIEHNFYVVVAGERLPARSETRGTRSDRTTAVHYVKFPLSSTAAAAWRERNAEVSVGVEHSAYSAETRLAPRVVDELSGDLA